MADRDSKVAQVRSRAVFFTAGTDENVQGAPSPAAAEVGRPPPRRRRVRAAGDTERMKLSRSASWFLLAFGVWSWFIWITFVKNLWKDGSGLAFDDAGDPTGYFWVHLTLAVVSFVLGTVVGTIGLRGVRALRRSS
ncbi:hypothetical protein GCM10018785_13250 [Streptomyces longispororuber]|uniref:Uncharacterized protein n=2 Tax=Streptomyces TaxID=1883 RepID=A0A918ZD20_9ACTN|nr:hypothetical protein GCM10018785_13250 [Streptomyces longispororuber]